MTDSIEQARQATAGALPQAAKDAINASKTIGATVAAVKSGIAADDTKAHSFINTVEAHLNELKATLATAAAHVEGELLEFFQDAHDSI